MIGGLYDRHVLPPLTHALCGSRPAARQREKIVPLASGTVLDVGFGSGRNLPFYDAARVTELLALEPSRQMWRLAAPTVETSPFPVRWLEAPAEAIPLADASVDTAVITYALCTVADPLAALAEIRRVLRPGGRLLFCEHGRAPDASVVRWQDRLNPLWRRLAGGCHLNRPVAETLERGGFAIAESATMYLPGWRPAGFNTWGVALPRT